MTGFFQTPTRSMSPGNGGGLISALHSSSSSPFQGLSHPNSHHHHHPHVGHATHAPTQTASGDAIVGPLPDEVDTGDASVSRGRVLLPATTAIEASHASGYATPIANLSLSRPVSPSPSPGHHIRGSDVGPGVKAARTSRASSPAYNVSSPVSLMATASNTPSRSRLSPAHSPVISARRSLHFHEPSMSMGNSQTLSNENAVFERDVEFTQEHLLSA